MLLQLNIKQFGIIDDVSIEFKNGLTVLTGETGAGKSMILAAISQLSGQRTSTGYIRHGKEKATVEGVFDFPTDKKILTVLESLGIDFEDEIIILKRDIYSTGKSICRVNNIVVNLSTLKKVSSFLLDMHEQHDNQTLLVEKKHLSLIDSYGKDVLIPFISKYKASYLEYKNLRNKIEDLEKNSGELLQKLDFIKYQIAEIEELELKENEVFHLKEELDYLLNYEKISSIINNINLYMYRDGGALELIYNIKILLEKLAKFNSNFNDRAEEISNFYYFLEDLRYDLSRFNDKLDYDENRLNEVENRLLKIKSLEKKYLKNSDELILFKEELKNQLFDLENYNNNFDDLKNKLDILKKAMSYDGHKLSNERKKIAKELEKFIQDELKFLCMEKSIIKIEFRNKDFSNDGIDDVRILISANLGEPLKSLSKVASGGELSRVMLALKIIFSNNMEAISIIFDEIDTGVSGRVSQRMAEKIYQLSRKSQVLCISHLPQTTALADTNLFIKKEVINDRTISNISKLNRDNKILEIARMISGTTTTKLSKEHAVEMLEFSEKIKREIAGK